MPEDPAGNQEKNRSAEQQRMDRITAVNNPELRAELEDLVKERNAKVAEICATQDARFEKDVEVVMRTRAGAGRDPNYRGLAWPASRAAAEQHVQVRNRAALEAAAEPYNEQIDRRLDEHDQQLIAERGNPKHIEEPQALLDGLPPHQSQSAEQESRGAASHEPSGIGARKEPEKEEPIDWQRVERDPEYRRDVLTREFDRTATEITQRADRRPTITQTY